MGKTLVIAEKPSVARDLAGALPGSFTQSKDKTHLIGDDHVITWAVGHLVGLAEPDAYDPKLKKWRFADLPIIPDEFKLVPNDERSAKQLKAIHKLMADDEVERIINACDAGREGELIFAYVYDLATVKKPVERLWLSSMTKKAISEAFEQLRPGEEMKPLEAAARSRSEADWVVGMNATRAASIRLRAAFDGAVSLGRVQTPTLALVARREEEIRAFKPEPYWLVEARFAATGERLYSGRYLGGKRLPAEEDAVAIVEAATGQPGEITKLEKKEEREQPQLLYDLTSLQRHANTLYGFSARRTLAAAQRLYEEHKALTYPRTNSRFLTGDMVAEIKPIAELVGHNPQYKRASEYVLGARQPAAGARGQRQEGPGPPRDHPHALRARPGPHGPGRAEGLRPRRRSASWRSSTPRRSTSAPRVETTVDRARLPHQRPAAGRGRLEGRVRRGGRPARRRGRLGRRPAAAEARPGRDRRRRCRSSRCARRRSRRGASPTHRCWARWRPPARRSRTPSCARR